MLLLRWGTQLPRPGGLSHLNERISSMLESSERFPGKDTAARVFAWCQIPISEWGEREFTSQRLSCMSEVSQMGLGCGPSVFGP